jgi:molecular chaperone GrpE
MIHKEESMSFNKKQDVDKEMQHEDDSDKSVDPKADFDTENEQDVLDSLENDPSNDAIELNADELLKEHEQKFLRLSADFANYKRRVEKEKLDIYRNATERLVKDLLPVIDNMERALSHSTDSPQEAFASGVEMVFKSLLEVLAKEGLKPIDALNQPFDHNLHHAVMTEDHQEFESDHVIGVLQKGYLLNEKVIRPAMVKVSN